MGGKSKSAQTSNNSTQNNNLAIQGDNEGQVIGGDGNSVKNTTTNLDLGEEFTGGDRTEYGDDFTNGNRTEIDGDFTGGNRTEIDGDFYNGNYTVTDGGAFKLVEEFSKDAFDYANKAGAEAHELSKSALSEMGNVVDDSLKFGSSALNSMAKTQSDAMDNVTDNAKRFAEELSDVSTKSVDAVNASAKLAIDKNSETTTKGLATIEQLAAKTALGGQTVVAEQAGKMAMYFMGGAGLIFLGLVVSRGGR